MQKKHFHFYRQLNAMDCGPACLRMIARYYGKHYNLDTLRQITGFSKAGVSLLGVSDTAEKIGFRTRGIKLSFEQLQEVSLPSILHWEQNHFVILLKVKKNSLIVADPGKGVVSYSPDRFLSHWASSKDEYDNDMGVVLTLEPTPAFYEQESEKENKLSWSRLSKYFLFTKGQLSLIFVASIITSLLTLIFPFLTQSIVDVGINAQDLQYVAVVLIAQTVLAFSYTIVGFIRSRVMLRISNILNIQILSDFWIKLMKLPISYFDVHHTGDTLQRIGDHGKIQKFLLGTMLSTFFSFINFIIYAIVLITYNVQLFFIFCAGNIIYIIWIQFFLKVRRKINFEAFHLYSRENNATLQLVQGMQEIRLNNAQKKKRWEWENLQANIFKLDFKSLNYSQIQSSGAVFISSIQGIGISFIVAKLVIEGKLTFGSMLAIQYIIGQLSSPIQQFVSFIQDFQDAKISMERLNEIHELGDEEDPEKSYITQLPENKGISINNLSFTYPGAGNNPVLENIDLEIPENKVTAIVGLSGSGKTTLIKILLKVYEQYEGEIRIGVSPFPSGRGGGGVKFNFISHPYWRSECGAVSQEGYIFNDSIARNIAVSEDEIDHDKLIQSCRIANIHSFIESLPNGYYTKLGADGTGVSQGQRQRILIARAVYKDPAYLFFDEATNALDANNEREIVENMERFFKGRTVVIVAHRLSTVKNADKIVVLESGKIAEEGTHEELTKLKGRYYELVKNQLELGN